MLRLNQSPAATYQLDDMIGDDNTETLKLEQRIKAEAERCAQAIKFLGGGELRFVPDDMGNAALLACFLLELEKQCAKAGAAARVVFCFYPCEPTTHASDNEPLALTSAIH